MENRAPVTYDHNTMEYIANGIRLPKDKSGIIIYTGEQDDNGKKFKYSDIETYKGNLKKKKFFVDMSTVPGASGGRKRKSRRNRKSKKTIKSRRKSTRRR